MQKWIRRVFGGMALLAVLASAPAAADDRDTCAKSSGDVAIAACTRAITSGKYKGRDLGAIYTNRGVEWSNKKDNDRAIQDHDQAIRLNPQDAEAFNNRGFAYDDKGQYDRAIQDYDQAIRLNPQYAAAFNNRGVAYGNKGQYDRAIQDYDQAIRLDPNFTRAINNRAAAMAKKKP